MPRLTKLRKKRLLWGGIAVCLVVAGVAGAFLWTGVLPERISGIGAMLWLALAWLGACAMHFLESHLGISAVLWVINPIVVYFGGWMFAVVLWMGLAMLLWATREGTFGWESIGTRPPDLGAD